MSDHNGQWIHMVGIAGAGMSGIAKVLAEQGMKVTGSDLQHNEITEQLEQMGITVYHGHSSSYLQEGVDMLVISSAIPMDNPEVILARHRKIPVLKRGQMLANLVNRSKGIAVAGAHGKTTTTFMIYTVLSGCGLDPAFIVGGELQDYHLNAKLGRDDLFVVEADESDASFLELHPHIAVVTNIEDDHLDYYHTLDRLRDAFRQYIDGVQPQGLAVLYGDDLNLRTIAGRSQTRCVFYGEHEENDYFLKNWKAQGLGSVFEVYEHGQKLGRVRLSVPGRHNALNALAAIATGRELGLEFANMRKAIVGFHGAKRRFQIMGEHNNILVIDDYAHHPTEIKATLRAARSYHTGRLITVFQPHRYSRTRQLGTQLGEALITSDIAVITNIYAAGEAPIPGISSDIVFKAAQQAGCTAVYIPDLENVIDYLFEICRPGDLIITMGAGDIWNIGPAFINRLKQSVPQA
ncbi:MAG TPA: UDP-N-acetylmuramate--L-alanine ligase [Syntrophomonadaceae bacterium]|nr:UDP-N-acetylmuramate--L-alanine ligase [Syntrophomonadaceae bacterium]HQA06832.1 UDP-N-acetylmuramate--L-alanine ligase [Syntrophomonadaceae bacterium]HQE22764.1 UDP-N-acetylmuramate--L-alanine ligase [Syntrophomonadaceae bacterium]